MGRYPGYRDETVSSTYDTSGNLLTQTQANGVVESSTWYPAADANDFVRRIAVRKVTPAASANGKAPTLSTHYTYKQLRPLTASPVSNWHATQSETLVEGEGSAAIELQRIELTYTDQPDDGFAHGRVEQQKVIINQKETITDYAYTKIDGPDLQETVLQTVETLTGFDHGKDGRNVVIGRMNRR